jgi:hypothetical protein
MAIDCFAFALIVARNDPRSWHEAVIAGRGAAIPLRRFVAYFCDTMAFQAILLVEFQENS